MGLNRFSGYNRHDYYYPRTSREAFGSEYELEVPKATSKLEMLYWVAIGTCAVVLLVAGG